MNKNLEQILNNGLQITKSVYLPDEANSLKELFSIVSLSLIGSPYCVLTTDLDGMEVSFEGQGIDGFQLRIDGNHIGHYKKVEDCMKDFIDSLEMM